MIISKCPFFTKVTCAFYTVRNHYKISTIFKQFQGYRYELVIPSMHSGLLEITLSIPVKFKTLAVIFWRVFIKN